MVSRETGVIVGFGTLALSLGFGGRALTAVDETVLIGVVLFVGGVVPTAVDDSLDRRDEAADAA